MSKRPPPPKRRPTVGQSAAPMHLQQEPPTFTPPVATPPPQRPIIPPSGNGGSPQAAPTRDLSPPRSGPPKLPPPPPTTVPPLSDVSPQRGSIPTIPPPPPTSTPRRTTSPTEGRRPIVPQTRADGSPRLGPTSPPPPSDRPQSTPRPPPTHRPPPVGALSTPLSSSTRATTPPTSRPPPTINQERTENTSRTDAPVRRPSLTGTTDEKPKTIRKISESTGVFVADIRLANPELSEIGDDETIPKGTRVRIPNPRAVSSPPPPPPVTPSANAQVSGETLAVVALKANVPLSVLQELNPHLAHVDPYLHVLPVGTTLHVPATAGVLESTPGVEDVVAGTPRSEMSQTAPHSESILDVARSTNTSVQDILRLNPFLQDHPLDKPLPPKTRIQLPPTTDEDSVPPSPTSTPSPSRPRDVASIATLREIAQYYDVELHEITVANVRLAAAPFGVDGAMPIGTKVTLPSSVKDHPPGTVHIVGEGPSAPVRSVISPAPPSPPTTAPPAPPLPTTLEGVARQTGRSLDEVRSWGSLDDHIEVGVNSAPIPDEVGMGVPANLWTVPTTHDLPTSVISSLVAASKLDITERESLDTLSSATRVPVDLIRKANGDIPVGYPSHRPVPRGVRIFIPKPPTIVSPPQSPPQVQRSDSIEEPPAPESPMLPMRPHGGTPSKQPSQAFDKIVASGSETLADIAARYGADVDELIQMNGALIDDPDEAFTDPLPDGVTVRIPKGLKPVAPQPMTSLETPPQQRTIPPASSAPRPEDSFPKAASPFLRRQQMLQHSEPDDVAEEPRAALPSPPQPAPKPHLPETIKQQPTAQLDERPLLKVARSFEDVSHGPDKFVPATTVPPHPTDDEEARRSAPTKTALASGNESLRNVCDTHFLTEYQLRAMNPFLERYHAGTLIPKNTVIVLETVGLAEEKVSTARQGSTSRFAMDGVEELDGRKVFVVRSPTRERPKFISPQRALTSPHAAPGSPSTPINTLRTIVEATGVSEQILRRRNPHLGLVGSDDELPKGTMVELEGSAMGPSTGAVTTPLRSLTTNNTALSLAKRNLNRRQVVRVMGHKTAVQVGQRYFGKWRLFVSLFNSRKLSRDIAVENEMEKLRVQVQAGKITESDLRRRVTELRMALDCTRPMADEVRQFGGAVQSPIRRTSPQRGRRGEGIAVAAAYNTDNNFYRQAAAGLNTESPTRLSSTPRRLQPVMMAGGPAVTENRVPHDRSREVGGIGSAIQVSSPLRDQPTVFTPTPVRNPSPYRHLMEATAQSLASPSYSEKSVERRNQRRSLGMLLNGLRVVRVSGASSAAGVQANDVILRVDGSLVSSGGTFRSLVERAKGPKVSVTLQTPTGHIFTVMLPLFSDQDRHSPSRGVESPSRRQSTSRSTLPASLSPYRRPISASRR